MKNTILIIALIILLIILKIVSFNIVAVQNQERDNNRPIKEGYSYKEVKINEEPWQSSYEYIVYYYDESHDKDFYSSSYYKKVEQRYEELKNKMNKYLSQIPKDINFDFDSELLLTNNNLFYLIDKSDNEVNIHFYLYDINNHCLHYIKIIE